MCLYSRFITNRKYIKNKKNEGNIPPMWDERLKYVAIGCQNCMECRKQKKREWQIRLQEEIKTNTNGKFIGLTFSNEAIKELTEHTVIRTNENTGELVRTTIKDLHGYDRDNAIATKAMRLFLERWRKQYKKSLRHFMITELGHNGTENIHMHGIIWTNEPIAAIEKHWKYGYVLKGRVINGKLQNYVNASSTNYIVKYINKVDHKHKEYKSKILTSPGIGNNYTKTNAAEKNKFNEAKTDELYRTTTGHKMSMPIYWRNKIYTDREREQLWMWKLDKEERWVCGEKIDVSITQDQYEKTVRWYRRINAELGYGNLPNENRKEYEEQRRDIMIKTRIKNAFGGK